MLACSKPKDRKSSSSCMRHPLTAVVQKTGKGNSADRKDSIGDLLPKPRLSEIENHGAGLGTAWQSD